MQPGNPSLYTVGLKQHLHPVCLSGKLSYHIVYVKDAIILEIPSAPNLKRLISNRSPSQARLVLEP